MNEMEKMHSVSTEITSSSEPVCIAYNCLHKNSDATVFYVWRAFG